MGDELGLRGRNWELNAGRTGEASSAEGSENLIFSPRMCFVVMQTQVEGTRLLFDGKDSLWWFVYVIAR